MTVHHHASVKLSVNYKRPAELNRSYTALLSPQGNLAQMEGRGTLQSVCFKRMVKVNI